MICPDLLIATASVARSENPGSSSTAPCTQRTARCKPMALVLEPTMSPLSSIALAVPFPQSVRWSEYGSVGSQQAEIRHYGVLPNKRMKLRAVVEVPAIVDEAAPDDADFVFIPSHGPGTGWAGHTQSPDVLTYTTLPQHSLFGASAISDHGEKVRVLTDSHDPASFHPFTVRPRDEALRLRVDTIPKQHGGVTDFEPHDLAAFVEIVRRVRRTRCTGGELMDRPVIPEKCVGKIPCVAAPTDHPRIVIEGDWLQPRSTQCSEIDGFIAAGCRRLARRERRRRTPVLELNRRTAITGGDRDEWRRAQRQRSAGELVHLLLLVNVFRSYPLGR